MHRENVKGLRYKAKIPAQIIAITATTIAVLIDKAREARGRELVLCTCGSISLSHKSLITQPAALVAKVPKIITLTSVNDGFPSAAKNTAHKAGIIKIKRPAGLSQRSRRIIVNQVGSGCCG